MVAGRNLDAAAEECWEFLGPAPKAGRPHPNPLPEGEGTTMLDKVLQARFLTTLVNLAARKMRRAGMAERLLKYVDAGIAAADKDDLSWQAVKYQLLVALDRPKALERALRAVVGGRRAGEPLAAVVGILVGRTRQAGRGDWAHGGRGRGRRAWPRRASHPGRLVYGRRPP